MRISRATGVTALLAAWLLPCVVCACRYNVRDVGFVDLGYDRYQLEIGLPSEVAPEAFAPLRRALRGALARFNVTAPDAPVTAPTAALTLVAPDGRRRPLDVAYVVGDDEQQLAEKVRNVLAPAAVGRLLDELIVRHSVVLLIDGTDAEASRLAAEAAERAIRVTLLGREQWAKPIEGDPSLVRFDRDAARELSLPLWCLGCDLADERPQAVVLYGRGRPLGAAMQYADAMALERALRRRLDYVSLDCECELDRSWMRGASFVHAWDSAREEQAARHLGFDPGNPLVGVEVRQIVNRSGGAGDRVGGGDEPPPLYGYQEFDLSELAGLAEDEAPAAGDSVVETAPTSASAVDSTHDASKALAPSNALATRGAAAEAAEPRAARAVSLANPPAEWGQIVRWSLFAAGAASLLGAGFVWFVGRRG